MPNVKDYNGKKKPHNKRRPHHEHSADVETHLVMKDDTMEDAHEVVEQTEVIEDESTAIMGDAKAIMEEADAINTEAQNEGVHASEAHQASEDVREFVSDEDTSYDKGHEAESKIHLRFYGSDVIREKAPKVMELADTVAEEWVKDGEFEGLPVGNPLAQMAAAKALRTAKDVEKKLEEKGVFAIAKMGIDYAKSKIQKRH
ncbi:hypothetical protein D3C87_252760 [compost metagenome]